MLCFIKHIFITNLQSIPPLLEHIFVIFLPSREKQINSLLLFVCVEVLWPRQPNGVMLSAVSLPNHTFTGKA